jgi:deazaflavin-dependent oxidoreductase (nitroreductase family)
MPMPLMPRDEAIAFNAKVVEEFRANGGRVGGILEGSLVILVHHVGVRTGLARITPLSCFPLGDQRRYAVIGSNGDSPTRPAWCANLEALTSTTVELGEESFTVTVESLGDAERDRLWSELFRGSAGPGAFEARTGRRLPVFLLTRTD